MGYKNIDEAYTGAGALPDVAQAGSQVSRSASDDEEAGINPIAAGDVCGSAAYGHRQAPIAGASTFHEGKRYSAPMGRRSLPTRANGILYRLGQRRRRGNMVQIDQPDGTKSVYLHLQSGSFGLLSLGDNVSQGHQIANGEHRHPTGPHLDFRIMVNGKYGEPTKLLSRLLKGEASGLLFFRVAFRVA